MQKVMILSREEDCSYEDKSLVKLHVLLTGLGNNIRQEPSQIFKNSIVSDEVLSNWFSVPFANEDKLVFSMLLSSVVAILVLSPLEFNFSYSNFTSSLMLKCP